MDQPTLIVQCAECAIIAPAATMNSHEHYGGFWNCADRTACALRWHLDLCSDPRVQAVGPVTRCMFCMAGTSHQRFTGSALMPRLPAGLVRRKRSYTARRDGIVVTG